MSRSSSAASLPSRLRSWREDSSCASHPVPGLEYSAAYRSRRSCRRAHPANGLKKRKAIPPRDRLPDVRPTALAGDGPDLLTAYLTLRPDESTFFTPLTLSVAAIALST